MNILRARPTRMSQLEKRDAFLLPINLRKTWMAGGPCRDFILSDQIDNFTLPEAGCITRTVGC